MSTCVPLLASKFKILWITQKMVIHIEVDLRGQIITTPPNLLLGAEPHLWGQHDNNSCDCGSRVFSWLLWKDCCPPEGRK